MVWFALTFVALTAFAGLAIEYNRWQQISTRAQKAADAAALGGAVFMPENVGNQAFTTAQTLASENGFTNGSNGVTVTTAAGPAPQPAQGHGLDQHQEPVGRDRRIQPHDHREAARWPSTSCPRTSGARRTSYGNDPESAAAQPQFWGNVFGPSSNKDKGDAIQSAGPTADATLCSVDNCGRAGDARRRPKPDYDAAGYFYGIDVPAGTTGALNVQVFDPAFVHVGDNCGASDANALNSLNNAATLTAAQIPGYTGTITPAVRYASAGSSAFCNGDNYYGDGSNTANPWTTWTLRAPDVSTWDPTNNPIVCQAEFPGVYPEKGNDLPTGTVDANELEDAAAATDQLPRYEPSANLRVVLPAVGDDLRRRQPRPGHVLPPGPDGQEDRRHGGSERRWFEPVLHSDGRGGQLRGDQRPAPVRQPEDGRLRERDRRQHAVLPDPRPARRGRQDARAQLLRHR